MVVAGRLVREKEAEAMISAGNTGALMTTGLLVVGRIPGIERPALAPMIPTMDGNGVLALDLGANMDATAGTIDSICDYGQYLPFQSAWHCQASCRFVECRDGSDERE